MRIDPERPIDPPEPFIPTCPCCGAECETIYVSFAHAVLGCDVCITAKDAYDYWQEEVEK